MNCLNCGMGPLPEEVTNYKAYVYSPKLNKNVFVSLSNFPLYRCTCDPYLGIHIEESPRNVLNLIMGHSLLFGDFNGNYEDFKQK